jgi:lysophospholipase L1-like esterase
VILVCLLAGCGNGEPTDSADTVVAALGDSITAGTPMWDPDPALRSQILDPDPRSQYGYWVERGTPGTDVRNCGVPGERMDEIERRLEECAEGADVLVVQGGVNDIAQGIPVARAARNLRDIVRRGKELGLRVTLVELLPWNGGYPAADRPIRALNRRIAAIGREEAVAVKEWYGVLEDPRRPGRMRLDLTSDLAHPSVEGYRRLGEALGLP